jgi:hypothetical protein
MGFKPTTRREALLHELCVRGGYCSTGLTPDDLIGELTADDVAELVFRREGLDPVMEPRKYEQVAAEVRSWLFDAEGRGEQSGLPR